jgi:hypothetical protein
MRNRAAVIAAPHENIPMLWHYGQARRSGYREAGKKGIVRKVVIMENGDGFAC